MKFFTLDGKRYLWEDLLKLRREQVKAAKRAQPVLFELREDVRPKSQRKVATRYQELTLFDRSSK